MFNNLTKENYLSLKTRLDAFILNEKAMNTDPRLFRAAIMDYLVRHLQTKEGNFQKDNMDKPWAASLLITELLNNYVPEDQHVPYLKQTVQGMQMSNLISQQLSGSSIQQHAQAKMRSLGMEV